MAAIDWSDPLQVLDAVGSVLGGRDPEQVHQRLSAVLHDLVPHRAVAVLSGQCARSPMSVVGDPGVVDRITSADLAHLASTVPVAEPWTGRAAVAGEERPVLVVAEADALMVVVLEEGAPEPTAEAAAVATRLWSLVGEQLERVIDDALPRDLDVSRVAAAERSRVSAELVDAHGATLSGILGTLRARDLDDRTARRAATDIAASALVELRTSGVRERALAEEDLAGAFARLREQLAPLTRYSTAELELATPKGTGELPGPVAQAARAIVRGAVLTLLEQEEVGRVRVEWELDGDLRVSVRDDGPGGLDGRALALRSLEERARVLEGTFELESPEGWGTRVLARLPLGAAVAPVEGSPLAQLNPRELDVLGLLARGQRNRQVAAELHISENTVKFHVANVLAKLGVSSRGEAAAVARDAGLGGTPLAVAG